MNTLVSNTSLSGTLTTCRAGGFRSISIDRPALVQRFRRGQWRRITHRQPLFALSAKIQLQQTINTMDPVVIPRVSLPP